MRPGRCGSKDNPLTIPAAGGLLRVDGMWTIAVGPSPGELYRHAHVFRLIDRPHRLLLDTTEARLDGSTLKFQTEFMFEPRAGKTLLSMIQHGFPKPEASRRARPRPAQRVFPAWLL